MASALRTLVAVTVAVAVNAQNREDAKCAKLDGGAWTVEAVAEAACTCTGCQWVQGYPQMNYPDHHPVARTWWAKRMADSGGDDADHHDRLYFGGYPSVRDMKYLYEAGFDAVLSLSTVTAAGTQGTMQLPTSAEAAVVAAEAGLLFHTLSAADFKSAAGVAEIAGFLDFALANLGQATGNGPICKLGNLPPAKLCGR